MLLFKFLFFYIADCGVLVFKEGKNTLQIISSVQTNANTATKICKLSGGNLYETTSKTSGKNVSSFLKENLISSGNLTTNYQHYYVYM